MLKMQLDFSRQQKNYIEMEGTLDEIIADFLSGINVIYHSLDEDIRQTFRTALTMAVLSDNGPCWEVDKTFLFEPGWEDVFEDD